MSGSVGSIAIGPDSRLETGNQLTPPSTLLNVASSAAAYRIDGSEGATSTSYTVAPFGPMVVHRGEATLAGGAATGQSVSARAQTAVRFTLPSVRPLCLQGTGGTPGVWAFVRPATCAK